ncbi:hypothetical protein ACFW9L_18175 [Streptomyces sp. NPDC059517]|uniref:hypothetical protein n=1 Tax=Streptomyces sp. NPDC059517 TaxID=3346855 RepID=UPI003681F7D7
MRVRLLGPRRSLGGVGRGHLPDPHPDTTAAPAFPLTLDPVSDDPSAQSAAEATSLTETAAQAGPRPDTTAEARADAPATTRARRPGRRTARSRDATADPRHATPDASLATPGTAPQRAARSVADPGELSAVPRQGA